MKCNTKSRVAHHICSQGGFILITILLLLSVLSVSAFVAVEQSQFSYKINHARIALSKARQVSENGRLAGIKLLINSLQDSHQHVHKNYYRRSVDRFQKDGLKHFLSVQEQSDKAEIFLQTLPPKIHQNGVSLAQNMTYSGIGTGLGGYGSFSNYYELRAKGTVSGKWGNVSVWTASEFRYIPK